MANDIVTAFRGTTEKLSEILEKFTADNINTIPFEKSWTGGQTVEHILKSQGGFPGMLSGSVRGTERDPESKRETIKKLFLDMSTKMKSPDFIKPSEGPHSKNRLQQELQANLNIMLAAASIVDLSKTYPDFQLPEMGEFTGLEWSWFIIYHTQRHINQLENIYKKVSEMKGS